MLLGLTARDPSIGFAAGFTYVFNAFTHALMPPLPVTKAHAYGNDFLFVPARRRGAGLPDLARRLCHRHHGIGADGLIVFDARPSGADDAAVQRRRQWSELSGNGLRCLAALVAREPSRSPRVRPS